MLLQVTFHLERDMPDLQLTVTLQSIILLIMWKIFCKQGLVLTISCTVTEITLTVLLRKSLINSTLNIEKMYININNAYINVSFPYLVLKFS